MCPRSTRASPAATGPRPASRTGWTCGSAPASTASTRLLAEGRENTFDLAFIDADKKSYPDYYERCLRLVRPGGVVALDNVLWGGEIADMAKQDRDTLALRAVNALVRDDERVTEVLLPVADGMTLARKR